MGASEGEVGASEDVELPGNGLEGKMRGGLKKYVRRRNLIQQLVEVDPGGNIRLAISLSNWFGHLTFGLRGRVV